jgi:hypothetical protein
LGVWGCRQGEKEIAALARDPKLDVGCGPPMIAMWRRQNGMSPYKVFLFGFSSSSARLLLHKPNIAGPKLFPQGRIFEADARLGYG